MARGYEYDHDAPDAFSGQDYFPEALGRQTFYDPPDRGFEREIRKRLDYWAKLRKERGSANESFASHLRQTIRAVVARRWRRRFRQPPKRSRWHRACR